MRERTTNGTDPVGGARRRPAYTGVVVDDFATGKSARYLHLGHWDDPTASVTDPAELITAQERMDEVVLGLLDVADGMRVLDAGCGFGGSLETLDRRHTGVHLLGLNIDPEQLAVAATLRPRAGNHLLFVRGDADRLPVRSDGVERILCLEALPHFPDRRRFLAECARVLVPGGSLVVADLLVAPDAPERVGRPRDEIAAVLDRVLGPWPDPFCTRSTLLAHAATVGLRPTDAIDATAATLPTHDLAFANPRPDPDDAHLRLLDAVALFRELHRSGALEYWYQAFVLPA